MLSSYACHDAHAVTLQTRGIRGRIVNDAVVLIDTGSRGSVFGGYLLGAGLMMADGLVAWRWGVAAERKPLEMVARPLTFIS